MTRNGKIARLPRDIRDALNTRLADGEQGIALVAWLNELPEVQEVLELYFEGRPMTEGNLTQWKNGGYQDWLRHQESLEWARLAADEAEELDEDGDGVPLSDRLAALATVALGKVIRALGTGMGTRAAETDERATVEDRRALLEAVRELTALRVSDHRAVRLKMDLGRWREEQAEIRKKEQHRHLWDPILYLNDVQNRETWIRLHTAQMSPEQEKQFRSLVNMDLHRVFAPAPAPPPASSSPPPTTIATAESIPLPHKSG